MNLGYSIRFVCLLLATFFLVHLVAGMVVIGLTNRVERFARTLRSRDGARLLLGLRFTPAVLAGVVVCCLCIPSYLFLEPEMADEPVGWLCIFAALCGLVGWLFSAIRAFSALVQSRRYLRSHPTEHRELHVGHQSFSVDVTSRGEPLFALAGFVHPRILVSTRAIDAYPPNELASALRHEQAHLASGDNAKRFAVLVMPDVLPFVNGLRRLDKAWMRMAEWAADDCAVQGNEVDSVYLASALVRAARMSNTASASPDFVTTLGIPDQDLAVRVERLLNAPAHTIPPANSYWKQALVVTACGAVLASLLNKSALVLTYGVLERLVR